MLAIVYFITCLNQEHLLVLLFSFVNVHCVHTIVSHTNQHKYKVERKFDFLSPWREIKLGGSFLTYIIQDFGSICLLEHFSNLEALFTKPR